MCPWQDPGASPFCSSTPPPGPMACFAFKYSSPDGICLFRALPSLEHFLLWSTSSSGSISSSGSTSQSGALPCKAPADSCLPAAPPQHPGLFPLMEHLSPPSYIEPLSTVPHLCPGTPHRALSLKTVSVFSDLTAPKSGTSAGTSPRAAGGCHQGHQVLTSPPSPQSLPPRLACPTLQVPRPGPGLLPGVPSSHTSHHRSLWALPAGNAQAPCPVGTRPCLHRAVPRRPQQPISTATARPAASQSMRFPPRNPPGCLTWVNTQS